MAKKEIPITKIHSYNVSVAVDVGVNAAVLFNNICFWVEENKANDRNFINGTWWTYNTTKALVELFPEMTTNQIDYALDKLIKNGYIKKDFLGDDPKDRTSYFTVCDFKKWIDGEDEQSKNKIPKCISENSEMEIGKFRNDIYINNNKENNTDINTTDITSNSISNDIATNSFSKEKGTNSTLPSNAAYVPFEERREKHKYQKDRYSNAEKEQAEDMLPERVEHIAYDYTGDKELSIAARDCIFYFVNERRKKIKTPMKVFTGDTLYNLVWHMFREQELNNKDLTMSTVYTPLIAEGVTDEYKEVIDEYFKIDFNHECDYSLAHFLTDGVQARIKAKLSGRYWFTNCSM